MLTNSEIVVERDRLWRVPEIQKLTLSVFTMLVTLNVILTAVQVLFNLTDNNLDFAFTMVTSVVFAIGTAMVLGQAYYGQHYRSAWQPMAGKLNTVVFRIALWQLVFVGLWSLLLLVPGIIKSFSYMQAAPLAAKDAAEGRELKPALTYITASREVMNGHKWQLFKLTIGRNLAYVGVALAVMLLGAIAYGVLYGPKLPDNVLNLLGEIGTALASILIFPKLLLSETAFSQALLGEGQIETPVAVKEDHSGDEL
jgi:hypothetical protein